VEEALRLLLTQLLGAGPKTSVYVPLYRHLSLAGSLVVQMSFQTPHDPGAKPSGSGFANVALLPPFPYFFSLACAKTAVKILVSGFGRSLANR
jgi:hypothetical protein